MVAPGRGGVLAVALALVVGGCAAAGAPAGSSASTSAPAVRSSAAVASAPSSAAKPVSVDSSAASLPRVLVPTTLAVPAALATGIFATAREMRLPAGFSISLWAAGLTDPRFMALDAEGRLYVSEPSVGKVLVLADPAGRGYATSVQTFASGLDEPHGLAFRQGRLYVADTDRVLDLGAAAGTVPQVVVPKLPAGGMHWTRTLGFGPAGGIYVSVGSDCNACVETDPDRATILRFAADGSGGTVYASGLRNAVGFAWNPTDNGLWAVVNGRDDLGDNIPPEELVAVHQGAFYGWPYCYGDRLADPLFDDPARCTDDVPPTVAMQAHSAPLGIAFYTGDSFPAEYRGGLFIAFHGSWDRTVPTGYKLVLVPFAGGQPTAGAIDFATGWQAGGTVWGRPVDPVIGPDGSLYLSDDLAGAIYRIRYGT